jgi:hypothetical protein
MKGTENPPVAGRFFSFLVLFSVPFLALTFYSCSFVHNTKAEHLLFFFS